MLFRSMPETEIQILAKAALKSALVGLPAGLACYFTCYAVATRALSASGNALSEPLAERILLSSANQNALTQYSMQTDSIFRNLPKLLPEEENEVYVGKSAGKNVSTIVTMDFPKTLALDGGGSLLAYHFHIIWMCVTDRNNRMTTIQIKVFRTLVIPYMTT